MSKPATRAEGEEEGEGEDEGEDVQTEGLVVVTGVEGVEGAGEGVNPRGPPAVAPDAPDPAPAVFSTSETDNKTCVKFNEKQSVDYKYFTKLFLYPLYSNLIKFDISR